MGALVYMRLAAQLNQTADIRSSGGHSENEVSAAHRPQEPEKPDGRAERGPTDFRISLSRANARLQP